MDEITLNILESTFIHSRHLYSIILRHIINVLIHEIF